MVCIRFIYGCSDVQKGGYKALEGLKSFESFGLQPGGDQEPPQGPEACDSQDMHQSSRNSTRMTEHPVWELRKSFLLFAVVGLDEQFLMGTATTARYL